MAADTHSERSLTLNVEDGVAVLTLDVKGDAVNTIFPALADEMAARFAEIDANPDVRAVVLVSGKKAGFLAGAKVEVVTGVKDAAEAEALSRGGQSSFLRIERSKKPVVAAIHGACLGGGLELALACHYRIAADEKKTALGLPEVMLGLIPGGGGTQRLPRLVGLAQGLDLILSGRQVKAAKAKSLGLVDEVVPRALLLEVAVRRARELADGKLAPERPKKAGDVKSRLIGAATEGNPAGRALVFRKAKEKLLAKTLGHYPAQERALEAIQAGFERGIEAGYDAEAKAFGGLAVSDVSRRLVEIFFAQTALKKDTGVDDPAVKPLPIGTVGVVGAGLMGSGVAYVSAATAGWHVRLRDRDDAAVGRGLQSIHGLFERRVKRKSLTRYERDAQVALISAGTDYAGFARVDLAVEAVFEDLALKQQVVRELEERLPEHAIVATNTSSLPIAKVAEASRRPERVVGMHYFSPVEKMPLLEVITHEKTLPEVTATAVAAGKAQGKTVIVVKDGVGFYTSRILAPYMNEAAWLLAEGARVEELDAALLAFGYPVGPVSLLDEVGIDIAAKVGHIMEAEFGERMRAPGSLDAFLKEGRLGRKTKKGFYAYDEQGRTKKQGGRKVVDRSAYDLLPKRERRGFAAGELAERLSLQMVNEAVHCLGEGILRSARDGDIGAVFGLGFPPFRGGPFRYVDEAGAAELVRRLEGLESLHGVRFRPAPLLVEHARSGRRFYERG